MLVQYLGGILDRKKNHTYTAENVALSRPEKFLHLQRGGLKEGRGFDLLAARVRSKRFAIRFMHIFLDKFPSAIEKKVLNKSWKAVGFGIQK